MTTRLARALLALALPLVAVPALTTAAHAAPKGPDVPTVEQVAKIYPQLQGGTADVESTKAPSAGKNCSDGKPVPGSRASIATYLPSDDDPASFGQDTPMVMVAAMSFRSVRQASSYFDDFSESMAECTSDAMEHDEEGVRVTTKKIRFGLGDERFGSTSLVKGFGMAMSTHVLVVREGKAVVMAMVLGSKSPVAKALRLTRAAVRAAG